MSYKASKTNLIKFPGLSTSMAEEDIIIPIILAAILGTIFFVADKFNPRIRLDPSFIAGVVTAYFFFVVLPELAVIVPHSFVEFPTLEYLFIVVGLAFAHVSEKIILQKVGKGTRDKAQELLEKEKGLEEVSGKLSDALLTDLHCHAIDAAASEKAANEILSLKNQEKELNGEIDRMRHSIQHHVTERLHELHEFTNVFYHVIIGMTLFEFLMEDLVTAFIFFIFALVMALANHINNHMHLFSELDIELDFGEHKNTKTLFALAAPIGIVVMIVIVLCGGERIIEELGIIFYLFSFVSGALLYLIIREVLPDQEKGRPLLFVAGLAIFAVAIVVIRVVEHLA